MPGPSGFRPAGARFVGALARSPATRCARLRADRRTGRETECFYLTLKGSNAYSSRKARLKESISGRVRYSKKVRSPVEIIASTGMPG